MSYRNWIKANKLSFTIFCLLFLVTVYTLGQTLLETDADLRITKIRSDRLDDAFLYKVNLKATGQITSPTDLHFIFEDGTTEKIEWDTREPNYRIDVKSPKRLEYLQLTNLKVPEKNIGNNSKQLKLWSGQVPLSETYSVPEYSYLTDEKGRIWIAMSGRLSPETKPAITLTILSPDGTTLLTHQILSTDLYYHRYPALLESNDQIYLIWSGYEKEGDPRQLFYTAFSESNGTFTQSSIKTITDSSYSLLRPITVSNESSHSFFLVEVEQDLKSSFCAYRLHDNGIEKIGSIHDQSGNFVTNEMIKEATLFKANDNSYHLIWTQQHYFTNIFFTRLTSDGEMLVPARSLSSTFSNSRINQLAVVPAQDKVYYFWSFASLHLSTIYHVYYMVTDLEGTILRDQTILMGPSYTPLRDISVSLDENGNFDMVWADGRFGSSKPMMDLVFQKMSPNLATIIPPYRITADSYTESAPVLTNSGNIRTLTWITYNNGKYSISLKSSDPRLVSALSGEHQLKETAKKIWDVIWASLASLGLQVFFVLPLNFAALISALIFALLFATSRIRNNLITWGSILLFILLTKFYSFEAMANQLGQFHLIKIADCYKISIGTLLFTLFFYYVHNKLSKKNRSSNELRFLYVMVWFLLDSFVLLLVDNLLMLS